jgi:hypothetical protein
MLSNPQSWLLAGAIGSVLSTQGLVSGQAPPLYQAPFFSVSFLFPNFGVETPRFFKERNHEPRLTSLLTLQRPDLNPPSFTWAVFDHALVTPGYILLTPYTAPPDSALAAAPQSVPASLLSLLSSQTGGCTLSILEAILSLQIQNGPYIYDTKGVSQRLTQL